MKNLTKIFGIVVIIFGCGLTLKAQPVLPPFENTWYGFNTLDRQSAIFLKQQQDLLILIMMEIRMLLPLNTVSGFMGTCKRLYCS